MINNDLLYYIPSGEFGKEGVLGLLKTHPEIRFVLSGRNRSGRQ